MSQDHIKLVAEDAQNTLAIGSGAPVILADGTHVWEVSKGTAEVYLQTPTARTLLAIVEDGGHIFSLPSVPDADFSVTGSAGTDLVPCLNLDQHREDDDPDGNALVKSAEHWINSIAALTGTGPEDGPAPKKINANVAFSAVAGERIASAQGVIWHLVGYGQLVQIAGRRPDLRGPLSLPLSGGLWTQLLDDQDVATVTTEEMLKVDRLIQAVIQFNGLIPQLLPAFAVERDQRDLERLNPPAQSLGASDTGLTNSSARAVSAVRVAAKALGVDVRSTLRARTGDFTELSVLIHQAGLLDRKITLTGRWWRQNQGPLIVMKKEGNQATTLLWHKGAYHPADGKGGVQSRISPHNAASFSSQAYVIHASLPDSVTGLWSLAKYLLPGVVRDGAWAMLAGAGMGIAGVLVPMATGWVFSDIVPSRLPGLLLAVGLALIAAALFSLIFSAARTMALQRIAGRTGIEVTAAVADKVLRLPARFFAGYSAGDLNQRIDAIDQMRQLITGVMISALITLTFSFLYLGLLFAYDGWLALLSLSLVLIYVLAIGITRAVQIRHVRRAAEQEGKVAGTTYETLAGITKLRVAAAETRALKRWAGHYHAERRTLVKIGRIGNHFEAFSDAFQTITLLCLFAAASVLISQDVPAGLFIGFLVAFGSFQGAFTGFCDSLLSLFAATPMAERAKPILASDPESNVHRADPGRLTGHIEMSGLAFSYGKGGPPVLNGIDLQIKAGEHLAIVGSSGSGKSTLIRLLLGFEDADRGSITYDGQDLSRLDLSRVRSQIGVVMQSSRLFAGSIYENIRGASDAGLEACLKAAESAGLAEDLALFPMGLHTPIVEGAGTFSGGQKQRILIARALAASPAILFFDEATSALDNATQSVVTDTLDKLGTTRITVAHRLSTVRNSDRICVLEEGRIGEHGTYDDLMARNGAFAALARRQLTDE